MKSWVSFRSSASSRPASRRMAKRDQCPKHSQYVPVDQVILLPRRIQSRDKGSGAVMITSEAGMAKFWDLFGHKRPIGKSINVVWVFFEAILRSKEAQYLASQKSDLFLVACLKELCMLLTLSPLALSMHLPASPPSFPLTFKVSHVSAKNSP